MRSAIAICRITNHLKYFFSRGGEAQMCCNESSLSWLFVKTAHWRLGQSKSQIIGEAFGSYVNVIWDLSLRYLKYFVVLRIWESLRDFLNFKKIFDNFRLLITKTPQFQTGSIRHKQLIKMSKQSLTKTDILQFTELLRRPPCSAERKMF